MLAHFPVFDYRLLLAIKSILSWRTGSVTHNFYKNMNLFLTSFERNAKRILLYMKLTAAIILLFSLQVSAIGYGQKKFTLQFKKASIVDILATIEKQSDFRFLYNNKLADIKQEVELNTQDATLVQVLDQLLVKSSLRYELLSNNLIVIKKEDLHFANAIQVKGRVTNSAGAPVAAASVVIKAGGKGVATNGDGTFSINAKEGDVLIISAIGYETQEITVAAQSVLNVVLHEAKKSIEEVVVVGYGTKNKAKVTGAIVSVKMDDILGDRPVTSTANLLQGALPGLNITIPTGQPGAATSNFTMNVRGGTSFSGGSFSAGSPFVVIDNIPYDGNLNLIDPNDIETVTLLKDAGSAAIYGSRSAYGVLLITTKRGGKNQKPKFTYSNNFVTAKIALLDPKATPLQWVQSMIDGASGSATNWLNLKYLLTDYQNNPEKYPGGYAMVNGVYTQLAPTNSLEQSLASSAKQQMHNFSVSGGSEKITYRFSGGTANENGIIVPEAHQDYAKRYNLKSVVLADVTDWMTVLVDANYNNRTSAQPFYQVGVASDFFQQVTNMNPLAIIDTVPGVGQVASPKYWVMNTAPVLSRLTDTRITGRVLVRPVKGLSIAGDYTIDRSTGNTDTYDKYAQGVNYLGQTVSVGTQGGVYTKSSGFTNYMNYNLYGTYEYILNKNHDFTLMAGMNNETSHNESFSAKTGNLIDPNNPSLSTGTSTTPAVSDGITEYANTGFFGRFDYDYKAKYLFQTSLRYDGSSKFPDGHRWVPAPSVSAGWRLMEEKFMHWAKPYVNEFKLRGSYGVVGNQAIGTYAYQGVMPSGYANWVSGGTKMITVNQPATLTSADFTWETVSSINFGADFRFLKNKLVASFDWYDRKTTGILTNGEEQLPATLGTGAPLVNAGALDSKGFEVQLGWKDKIGKVKYYAAVNLSNYQSTITKVSNPTNIINNLYVGRKMGEIWGFETERLYTVDDFVPGTLKGDLTGGILKPGIPKPFNTATGQVQNPNVGDIMYKDLNGDGIVNVGNSTLANPGDRKIIGNSTPQYQFGITGGVSYRNFDFSFVLFGVGKQQQYILNSLTFPNYWAGQTALYANELDYWTPNNPQAHYARMYTSTGVPVGTGAPAVNQNVQTRYLLNTQYLRVKNLTLSYGIPKALLKKVNISTLSFFYSLEDPFIWDHLPKGVYPDITRAAASSSGSGGGQGYPMMRRSSVGLNLSF